MTEQTRRQLAAKVEAANATAHGVLCATGRGRQTSALELREEVCRLSYAVRDLADALAGVLDDADRRGPDEVMEDAAREAELTPGEILEREG